MSWEVKIEGKDRGAPSQVKVGRKRVKNSWKEDLEERQHLECKLNDL